jgi:hypothetical protein
MKRNNFKKKVGIVAAVIIAACSPSVALHSGAEAAGYSPSPGSAGVETIIRHVNGADDNDLAYLGDLAKRGISWIARIDNGNGVEPYPNMLYLFVVGAFLFLLAVMPNPYRMTMGGSLKISRNPSANANKMKRGPHRSRIIDGVFPRNTRQISPIRACR